MRKRARTAPMMAPATVMEFDLSAWDWPEAEQTFYFSPASNSYNERTQITAEIGCETITIMLYSC